MHTMMICLPSGISINQRDVILPVVPMFHVNAWGLPFGATMMGAKIAFPGPHLDAVSLRDLCQSEQVTLAAGVPTIWFGILQALDKNPTGWKLARGMKMAVGGSAAPESMIRAFDKYGLEVLHAWGMTELSPVGSVAQRKNYLDELSDDEKYALRATQGLPAPFVDIRAVNQAGEMPWDGQTIGELPVRGPWVPA